MRKPSLFPLLQFSLHLSFKPVLTNHRVDEETQPKRRPHFGQAVVWDHPRCEKRLLCGAVF
jgi:hypothetical protein